MMKILQRLKNRFSGGIAMMINFFAMQIERGWITIEQVPKRYRAKVKELLELSGIESETKAEGGVE
ncbi:hypothetical protein I2503_00340 [Streptococcus mitis]|nr:hypothetical protein [Streptococcus sp. NLN64]